MEVTYTPTLSDYICFNRDTILRVPRLLAGVLASILLVPAIWGLMFFSAIGDVRLFLEVTAALAALWTAGILWSLRRSVVRRMQGSPLSLKETTARIDPQGFHLMQEQMEMQLAWPGVYDIALTPHHIYLYRTRQNAWVIPKRAFVGKADAEAFQRAAVEYWKAGRRLNSAPELGNQESTPATGSRIAFDLTLEDVVHYEKMFIGRVTRVSTAKVYGFSLYMIAIGLILFGFTLNGHLGKVFSINIMMGSICVGWGVISLLSRSPWQTRRRVRQLVDSTPGLTGARTVSIDPSGYYETTSVMDLKLGWAGLHDVTEEGGYIYVFESPIRAHPIPKRAFDSEQTAQLFFHAARGYLQQAKSGALVDKLIEGSWPPAPHVRS